MQSVLLLIVLCAPIGHSRPPSSAQSEPPPPEIFVSPFGSDANSGSEAAPFLTLQRAQQAARTARKRLGRSPRVVIQQGTHRLKKQPALAFTSDDSGTSQTETLWMSARPKNHSSRAARLSGGIRLLNWEQVPGDHGVWRAKASAIASSAAWPFRTLRVGDRLWTTARWPAPHATRPWHFLANWSCDTKFHPCTRWNFEAENRARTGRIESTIPATLGIDPRDISTKTVGDLASADLNLLGGFERDTFSQVLPLRQSPSPWNFSNPLRPTLAIDCYGYSPEQRYFFSNVKAGLVPGTWWLDRDEKWLYLYPNQLVNSSEWLQSIDVSAPSSTTLIKIRGAQWLHLSRIAFIDTTTLWQGYMGSASHQPSTVATSLGLSNAATAAGWPDCAVRIEDGSAQITISNSSFEQLGGCGIAIRGGVESVQVIRCLFTSIAAHGIMVHGFEDPAPGDVPRDLLFHSNVFSRIGVVFAGASPLSVDGGAFVTISQNRFEETPRHAIGLSSSFRNDPMVMTTNVVIKDNVIRDTCMETDDTGAIVVYAQQADDQHSNLSFLDQSILIERNNISRTIDQNSKDGQSVCTHGAPDLPGHMATCRNHSWAIYCDGVSSGVNVSSNILGGATQGGVYFHQGGLNTAQNNIIVDGTQYQLCLGTADQIASVLRSNIFVWRNPAAKVFCDFNVMPGKTSRDDILRALAYSDYNLFWCTDPSVDVLKNSSLFPLGGDGGLDAWRLASKFDTHSIVEDPLFVAPDRGDYSLRSDSPAKSKLRFQPISAIDPLVPHAQDVGADQQW